MGKKRKKVDYSWDVPQRSLPRVIYGLVLHLISEILAILTLVWLLVPDSYLLAYIPPDSDLLYFIPEKKYGIYLGVGITFTMMVIWPCTIFLNYFIYDERLNGKVEL